MFSNTKKSPKPSRKKKTAVATSIENCDFSTFVHRLWEMSKKKSGLPNDHVIVFDIWYSVTLYTVVAAAAALVVVSSSVGAPRQ